MTSDFKAEMALRPNIKKREKRIMAGLNAEHSEELEAK
jgi:hypothetical protein